MKPVHRIARFATTALFLALLASSCVSLQEDAPAPRLEANQRSLEAHLAKDDLALALPAWSLAKNRSELDPGFLDGYGERLAGLLSGRMEKADAADWTGAWTRLRGTADLRRFQAYRSPGASSSEDVEKVLRQAWSTMIQGLAAAGFRQIALIEALGNPDYLRADPSLLEQLEGIARELPNPWAQASLASLRHPTAAPAIQGKLDPSQVLKACVTVWVDQGIRFERGVGVPDIVIGSAFFIEEDGYLLTNHHVVKSLVDPRHEEYARLFVRLGSSNGEKIPARVVAWDSAFDLALIKVERKAPAVVPLSRLDQVPSGTRVMAFGSPGGLDNTVTAGISSNSDRRLLALGEVMQIDAPINPGNSGGPLMTEQGVFAGMVFAGIPQFQGINFGVSARWICDMLAALAQGGELGHPWLGMRLFEYRDQVRALYVVPGSPAWQLGVEPGAVIQSINGQAVGSIGAVYRLWNRLRPDDLVVLAWAPAGDGQLLSAEQGPAVQGTCLASRRPDGPLVSVSQGGLNPRLFAPLFGFSAENISTNPLELQFRIREVIPGAAADETGLSAGDSFTVIDWVRQDEPPALFMVFQTARKSRGFLVQTMQMGSLLELPDFL